MKTTTHIAFSMILFVLVFLTACAQDDRWNNLSEAGRVAFQQGQYEEAATRYREALQEANRFAENDPRLETTLDNLARIYEIQGKYSDAESLNRRLWEIKKATLGEKHPGVVQSMERLADTYEAEEKYAEAEQLHGQAVNIREESLGLEHPEVARSLEKRAVILRKLHLDDLAAPLEERAAAIRAKRKSQAPPSPQ